MKRCALLFVGGLCLLPFACSSASDSTAQGALDGSVADTGVPETTTGDTGVGDGATSDAPSSSPMTITVANKRGTPTVGALVVFHDATGAVIETKMTGSDGKASRVVDAGSQVTVAVIGSQARQLITFVGVKPGDDLKALDATNIDFVQATITLPGSLPVGTTGAYVYSGSTCHGSGAGATVSFTVDAECQNGTAFPALALAHGSSGQSLGFSFKKGNTYLGSATSIMGLSPWVTTFGAFSLATTNVPDAGETRIAFSHVADGVIAYRDLAGSQATPKSFQTYPGFADSLQAEAHAVVFDSVAFTAQVSMLGQRFPPTTTSASFDLTQTLPAITKASIDSTDGARPKLTWTTTESLATTDGGGAMLLWDASLDGSTQPATWTFIVPPETTSIQAPAMPAAASAWLPTATTMYGPPSIAFIEAASITGYDQTRANAAAMFPILTPNFVWDGAIPVLPVDGLVRTTWLMLNGA